MNRRRHSALAIARSEAARGKVRRDRLEGVSCGNLRPPPAIVVPTGRPAADVGPRRLERVEPHAIDRLEWQLALEPRLRRRVEIASHSQRPLTVEFGAI